MSSESYFDKVCCKNYIYCFLFSCLCNCYEFLKIDNVFKLIISIICILLKKIIKIAECIQLFNILIDYPSHHKKSKKLIWLQLQLSFSKVFNKQFGEQVLILSLACVCLQGNMETQTQKNYFF